MTSAPDPAAEYDLEALHDRLIHERDGEVDDSIPELERADPDLFGISLCLPDGTVRSAGHAESPFAIQSAVKPFLYALALADRGDEVLDAVGTEPTGEAFDAVRLESGTGRPPNPMVNAGAILTASLVDGSDPDERIARIRSGIGAFAGREVEISEEVSGSEQMLGDRNLALAHLMREEKTLHVGAEEALSVYSDACAALVTSEMLAVMGATLAFGGRNPVTGQQVVSPHVACIVMAVMATCGVYDGSGRWMRRVGIAAKSGVSGSIVMSSPDRLGIAVFSPPLDPMGTSVRGARVAEVLSDDLGLHVFATAKRGAWN